MRKPLFTPEELEELRRADEEIEANFFITSQERRRSNERDVHSRNERRDNRKMTIAAYQKAYYEENKEAIAARRKARRCAKKQTALEAAI